MEHINNNHCKDAYLLQFTKLTQKIIRLSKRAKFFLFCLLVFFQFALYAQVDYYYYNGEKVYLEVDRSKLNVTAYADFQPNSLSSVGVASLQLESDYSTGENLKRGVIEFSG